MATPDGAATQMLIVIADIQLVRLGPVLTIASARRLVGAAVRRADRTSLWEA